MAPKFCGNCLKFLIASLFKRILNPKMSAKSKLLSQVVNFSEYEIFCANSEEEAEQAMEGLELMMLIAGRHFGVLGTSIPKCYQMFSHSF